MLVGIDVERSWGLQKGFYRYRLPALLVFAVSLLIPNVAIIVGGFHGFFLTYFMWATLIAVAIPLLLGDGRGSLSATNSILLALLFITGLTALGFFLGFDARRFPADPVSFLVSLGLFLVYTLGVEIGRSTVMTLAKRTAIRVVLGTLGGIVLGSTAPALLRYISKVYSEPLAFLEDMLYSLILSTIHEYGGLGSGMLFRVAVDGYWRFAPLVLTSSIPSILRSAILTLAYYTMLTIVLTTVKGLRGRSRELFEFSYVKKVLSVLPEVFSIALALIFLILALNKFIPFVIISGSMSPTLNVGDIVIVHSIGSSGIKVGDIIAYRMEGRQIVVHRVVYMGPEGVRTKGDANPDPDPFIVRYSEILGKVVLAIPKLGYITIIFQTGGLAAYLAIAISMSLVLLLVYVRRHFKSRRF